MSTLPPLTLQSIDIKDLDLAANPADVRYDLHAFADYVRSHEIKRGFRSNRIPTAHQQKLSKLLSDPASAARPDQWGDAAWIEHLDALALALNWVRYDTKGQYMGYTSSEPSFPDNFMKFEDRTYARFVEMPLREQEARLVAAHVEGAEQGASEFFSRRTLSRLDPFDAWGCATGVVPTIAFSQVRRHLLQLLARCPVGLWFSTASLVDYLREHEPWFLIPKERHADTPTLIIGMYVEQIQKLAEELGIPILTGSTPQARRDAVYAEFKAGRLRQLVVSKIANFSVDLPDAAVAIQISGTFGSRQEEAQRLGRVLRPKPGENQAHFYSLVSRDTVEQDFAMNRQLFLCEQGYEYAIWNLDSLEAKLPPG